MAKKKQSIDAQPESKAAPKMHGKPVHPTSPEPKSPNPSIPKLAVGHWDGQRWVYLSAYMNGSNLMGTTVPYAARKWENRADLDKWVSDLSPENLAELASKQRHIVKIKSVHEDSEPEALPVSGPNLTPAQWKGGID